MGEFIEIEFIFLTEHDSSLHVQIRKNSCSNIFGHIFVPSSLVKRFCCRRRKSECACERHVRVDCQKDERESTQGWKWVSVCVSILGEVVHMCACKLCVEVYVCKVDLMCVCVCVCVWIWMWACLKERARERRRG